MAHPVQAAESLGAVLWSIEIANCLKYNRQWDAAIDAYKKALLLKPDQAMQYRIFNSLTQCSSHLKNKALKPDPALRMTGGSESS